MYPLVRSNYDTTPLQRFLASALSLLGASSARKPVAAGINVPRPWDKSGIAWHVTTPKAARPNADSHMRGSIGMTNLVEHFERFLGPITSGWSVDPDGQRMHVQILKFHSGPLENVAAYSTLGLSRHMLLSPSHGKPMRLELLMMVRRGDFERSIPSLLQQLADESIEEGRALLRGDVIGPRGVLDPNTSLEAMFVCAPVYLPDEFSVCEESDGPVVIAWLIPLFTEEASFALTHGWEALEKLLVQHDPDLTDWHRTPLPVH